MPVQTYLTRFVDLAIRLSGGAEVNYHDKKDFHLLGMRVANAIANNFLGLHVNQGQYDVRSQKGGDGIWGEVILHTDNLYVSFTLEMRGRFMYRSCASRHDFKGGQNRFMEYERLRVLGAAVGIIVSTAKTRIIETRPRTRLPSSI